MELTGAQRDHLDAMRDIAVYVSSTPMVLKGGTGLLLCYGLDRFSEDLDFDCPKKISLESRIKSALLKKVANPQVKLLKDGDNVTRYRLTGRTRQGDLSIKIETSHRDKINPDDVSVINGIRVYKLPVLAGMKLAATDSRTAPRDLFDIHFIARSDMSAFQGDNLQKLRDFIADTNSLLARYESAFKEDPILCEADPASIILELADLAKKGPKSNTPTNLPSIHAMPQHELPAPDQQAQKLPQPEKQDDEPKL
jgi:hypothetical protein